MRNPFLLEDECGIMVSPTLIPKNFLELKTKVKYIEKLSIELKIPINILDFSFESLNMVDSLVRKEENKILVNSLSLYLPLLSYIMQSIEKNYNASFYIEEEQDITNDPSNGFHNVRIRSLFVRYDNERYICLSRLLLKEFSKYFNMTILELINTSYEIANKTGRK